MALHPCFECNSQISDKAAACPQCGAPSAFQKPVAPMLPKSFKEQRKRIIAVIAVGVIAAIALEVGFPDAPKLGPKTKAERIARDADSQNVMSAISAAKDESREQAACTKSKLECAGDKNLAAADVFCPPQIERLASYTVKWTDSGFFEQKFSGYRWRNEAGGEVTYVGDKVQFQNGFGAYVPMIYECDVSADGKVLDVRARQGSL